MIKKQLETSWLDSIKGGQGRHLEKRIEQRTKRVVKAFAVLENKFAVIANSLVVLARVQ